MYWGMNWKPEIKETDIITLTVKELDDIMGRCRVFKVRHPMLDEPVDGIFPDTIDVISPHELFHAIDMHFRYLKSKENLQI